MLGAVKCTWLYCFSVFKNQLINLLKVLSLWPLAILTPLQKFWCNPPLFYFGWAPGDKLALMWGKKKRGKELVFLYLQSRLHWQLYWKNLASLLRSSLASLGFVPSSFSAKLYWPDSGTLDSEIWMFTNFVNSSDKVFCIHLGMWSMCVDRGEFVLLIIWSICPLVTMWCK